MVVAIECSVAYVGHASSVSDSDRAGVGGYGGGSCGQLTG